MMLFKKLRFFICGFIGFQEFVFICVVKVDQFKGRGQGSGGRAVFFEE